MTDLGAPGQVTHEVTLYLTGLDGAAVELIAHGDRLALSCNGLQLTFLLIEGYS